MSIADPEILQYTSEILLEGIPKQWMPKIELYYPDLPQFPIVYIHIVVNGTRIYGFPASIAYEIKDEKQCSARLLFICNKDLDKAESLKEAVKNELEERFGLRDKVGITDIIKCCNGDSEYEKFFTDLWQYMSHAFGDYVPYGKFYEEIYSIVRFVSAWQPKTGRQSEMRMLYNFLSIFGQPIKITAEWDYLEFFLLPTYDDILNNNLDLYPDFQKLYITMNKVWDACFTEKQELDGTAIKSMKRAWDQDKDSFIKNCATPLCKRKIITAEQQHYLERLVDAFNRHSWRAAFFLWSIMTIKMRDYRTWDKDYFIKFYLRKKNGVGISEKVVACFLQQGFKNPDAIPIDIWVECFYRYPLGISEHADFFNKFSNMGKLERVIWLSSQANKTNIKSFFYLLWCQRYGVTGNNELRGVNPIACYECLLRNTCVGFSKIVESKVLLKEEGRLQTKETKKGKVLCSKTLCAEAEKAGCSFICLTQSHIPKKVFVPQKRGGWKLIDEFSGYLLSDQTTNKINKAITVKEFIESLPTFP